MGIGDVGLAALTDGVDPDLGRQLGRHIDHHLAGYEEPLCDVSPDPAAALDRPHPIWEPADIATHRGEPGLVGGIPATAEDQLVVGHHLDGDRPLVWIHPNHNPLLLLLLCHCLHLLIDTDMSGQEGTAA